MKAERRHELKENDLAHAIEVTREYLSEHGGRIGMVIVAAVAVTAVVTLAMRSRAATIEDAWRRKSTLDFASPDVGRQSLQALSDMTSEATEESFVLTALMDQGTHALRLAQEVDEPPDPQFNEKAREAFEELLARFGDNPLAFVAAHSGLATVEENAFVMDHEPVHKQRARDHLTAITEHPGLHAMPYHRMAMDRLSQLDEVFTVVRFALAPPEEDDQNALDITTPEGLPIDVQPLRIDRAEPEPVDTP